jgi:DNA-binding LacI/PurR family transcriptional regulator
MMSGVVRILRQHDIVIPDDMSLSCFDDIDWFATNLRMNGTATSINAGINIDLRR